MKSFVFCTSFLGVGSPHGDAPTRYRRWLDYYGRNLGALGADRLFLVDDGSDPALLRDCLPGVDWVDASVPLPAVLPSGPLIFHFPDRLGRTPQGFPGWWRSFTFSMRIAETYGYMRILHLESDLFILTPRLAAEVAGLRAGWTTIAQSQFRSWWTVLRQPRRRWDSRRRFWRNKLRYLLIPFGYPVYPECAFQVICEDQFPKLRGLLERGRDHWDRDGLPEFSLPFTTILEGYIGQRYGECLVRDYPAEADYVAQADAGWRFDQVLGS